MCFDHHLDPLSYDGIIANTRIRWTMPARRRLKNILEDFDSIDINLEKLKAQVEKLCICSYNPAWKRARRNYVRQIFTQFF